MHHQKVTRTAPVLWEVSHCFPHWDGGYVSSKCVEKLVGIAGVKLLEIQVPREKCSLNFSFCGDILMNKHKQVFVSNPSQNSGWRHFQACAYLLICRWTRLNRIMASGSLLNLSPARRRRNHTRVRALAFRVRRVGGCVARFLFILWSHKSWKRKILYC